MFHSPETIGILLALASSLAALIKVAFDSRKAKRDTAILQEGMAALTRVVDSNQRVIESFVAAQRQSETLDNARLELERNRLELDRTKALGGLVRYFLDNAEVE